MSGFDLRPLSLGELLDRAFSVYRRNFWVFVGIAAFPACLLVPAQSYFLGSHGLTIPWVKSAPHPHVAGWTYGLLVVEWIIYTATQAAMTYAAADIYLGRAATIRGSYGRIRGHFLQVLGLSLNVGFRVFGLMVLLVIGTIWGTTDVLATIPRPGPLSAIVTGLLGAGIVIFGFGLSLAFAMRYAVSLPALLIEKIKGNESINRSILLSDGRRGQIFLAVVLGLFVIYSAGILFRGPFIAATAMARAPGHLSFPLATAMSISSAIGQVIAYPMLIIILVIFYYDLRIRKEAFDLQQMMASLPGSRPAVPASLT